MAKDKEVNMTVTNLKARVIFPLQVIFGQVKYLWVNSLVFLVHSKLMNSGTTDLTTKF
jgi:hypothetical protein